MNFLPITFHLNREGPIYSLRENIKEFIEFFNYVKDNTNLSNTWIMKPTNMNQGKYKITKVEIYICLILCNHSYNFQKSKELRERQSLLKKISNSKLEKQGHLFCKSIYKIHFYQMGINLMLECGYYQIIKVNTISFKKGILDSPQFLIALTIILSKIILSILLIMHYRNILLIIRKAIT